MLLTGYHSNLEIWGFINQLYLELGGNLNIKLIMNGIVVNVEKEQSKSEALPGNRDN